MTIVTPSPFQSGFRLIDGSQLNKALSNPAYSSQDNITATASGVQSNAYQLSAALNNVTTVGSGADSLRLPPAVAGAEVLVANNGANAAQVYGHGTDTINSVLTTTGVSQAAGSYVLYTCFTKGNWQAEITSSSTIGALTVTTINKYTLTVPASGATLTIADGKTLTANQNFTINGGDGAVLAIAASKTLTVSNILTLAGTDSTTMTFPGTSQTIAGLGTAQTWTAAQTFTNSDLKLLGSSTGATTFTSANAGASNFTTTVPAVTGTMASTSGSNLFIADVLRSSATVNPATTGLVTVTGLSGQTLVAGATYRFRCVLPGLADGTSGVNYAFKYTTATLTSIEATGIGYTASAVAVQHTTTTTDATLLFDQAAAVIMTILEGTMVVNAGGTVALQTGLHTGTTAAATYVGSTMQFTRIA